MGVHDIYCVICGGPTNDVFLDKNEISFVNKKKYKWLNNLLLITNQNKIIKVNGKTHNDYYSFGSGKNKINVSKFAWHFENNTYGILTHKDCYKLLYENLNYKLNFNHLCRVVDNNINVLKKHQIYGKMKEYSFTQSFNYHRVIDNDEWLILSPLQNDKNKKRITMIWKSIIKKLKKKIRPSPCESATNFKIGFQLKGNDGNLYEIVRSGKSKKWKRIS
jgi:hypothetical protein